MGEIDATILSFLVEVFVVLAIVELACDAKIELTMIEVNNIKTPL
jgi:hypothetical protein